jgi:hypothetical protein
MTLLILNTIRVPSPHSRPPQNRTTPFPNRPTYVIEKWDCSGGVVLDHLDTDRVLAHLEGILNRQENYRQEVQFPTPHA